MLFLYIHIFFLFTSKETNMSDKSDLKAELERKKQRLAQIREEKKRKEEERKKKEVSTRCWDVGDAKENHLILRDQLSG